MTDFRSRPTAPEYTVLLYSDDPEVRRHMRLAVGDRPTVDMRVRFVEAWDYAETVRLIDDGVDVLLLDGEAAPAGGLGIARQVKDEVPDPPPVCVVIARAADRWLAAYARVEATLMHPMDPVQTANTIASLIRTRAETLPAVR